MSCACGCGGVEEEGKFNFSRAAIQPKFGRKQPRQQQKTLK